jgi:sodium-dependent dicarboxylate transporter 2/3/5
MATQIGTPPNLILAGVIQETYGIEISLGQWFAFGFPISLLFLFLGWLYLTRFAFKFKQKEFPGGRNEINKQLNALGDVSFEEKIIFYVFVATAFAWIFRSWVLQSIIPSIDDTIIAVIAAVILFILPSGKKGIPLLNWNDAVKLPWGILLLFGGGMALAIGFQSSGLALWTGEQLKSLETLPLIVLLLIIIASVNFITEITSNIATTALMLPVLASLANAIDVHPFFLLVGATVAASCAFMLPVATPPNAIVFGSGHLKIEDMVKKGLWMNVISIIILTLMVYFILPIFWEFPALN